MTENYFLVRVDVRRWVNSTDITTVSSVYNFDLHTKPLKVFGSLIEYTYVADTTTPSTNEWSYVNGKVYMYEATDTDEVAVVWPMYVTHSRGRVSYVDPTDTNTDSVYYEPRLMSVPSIRYTTSDQFFGVVSSDSINMSIAGDGGFVESKITTRDQLTDQTVKVWRVSDGTASFLFEGDVKDFSYNTDNVVMLDVASRFDYFNRECLMGDLSKEVYLTQQQTDVVKLRRDDSGKPIPYAMAKQTSFNEGPVTIITDSLSVLEPSYLIPARCIDYSDSGSTSGCRKWSVLRKNTLDVFDEHDLGDWASAITPTIFGYTGPLYIAFNYDDTAAYNDAVSRILYNGTVKVTYFSQHYYGHIVNADPFSEQIYVEFDINYYSSPWSKGSNLGISASFEGPENGIVPIIVKGDKRWVLKKGRDFTVTETSLSNNDHVYITLTDNCETNFQYTRLGTPGIITPDEVEMYVAYKFDNETKHGTALKRMVEANGLTVNASQFSTHTATGMAATTVPKIGNITVPTYADVISDLTRPLLGQVFLRSDGDIGYKTCHEDDLGSPSNDTVLYDSDIIDAPALEYDTSSLIKDVTFYNDQSYSETSSSTTVSETNRSKQFGSVGASKFISHGLETIPSNEQTRFLERFDRPVPFIRFKSPLILNLGDDINISNLTVLPNTNWRGRIVDASYGVDVSNYRAILLKEV